MRVWAYLAQDHATLKTRTCRVKALMHDNAFSILLVTVMNAIGWVVTVLQCH